MLGFIRYMLFIFFILLSLIVVTPLCILRPFNTKNGNRFFKTFHFFMRTFAGIEVFTEGTEIVEKAHPGVLIGNHQHNYDILSVAQVFTNYTVVLGKFELGLIPYFGQIYVLCGNILVKRGNRKQAMKSMKELEKNIVDKALTVLVFPEGHRNNTDELLPFKKGAYYTAIRTQSPLIPFSVSQFTKHSNFNKFKKVNIYVKVHEPLETKGLTNKDIPQLITKSRELIQTGIIELNQNYS
jgi:1-acyl-sn-glycerol-3-phosphate acyltransferase